jgi:ABC-type nitrate/sulfonate/bicarbonate transport system substrate-binding protein
MKSAIPDVISNSYFPALAAVELGFFKDEGLDMTFEQVVPVDKAMEAMRDGEIDFVAGSSHSTLAAFPQWEGAKLLGALAQGMYWFLIVRTDLNATKGDINAVKGLRIGAAPMVEMGLRHMLAESGIDIKEDKVEIAPVPGGLVKGKGFGMMAAKALAENKIDAFWANGMGAEAAVRGGAGTILLDVRRGDGPAGAFNYTFPVMVGTDAMIEKDPESVAAVIRALVKTQKALIADVSIATKVGEKLFSPEEAVMIADVVERDLPFYDASLSPEFVVGQNKFSQAMGILGDDVSYEQVVATQFQDLWKR